MKEVDQEMCVHGSPSAARGGKGAGGLGLFNALPSTHPGETMTIWTKKHTTFSVQNRLTPTARELWQWLLDEMPEGSNEIIDLRDFNKWVKKTRGTPHDPKTVKSAAKQLVDAGVVIHTKSYTAYVWRWTLKSINLLLPPISRPTKKKSALPPQIPDLDPSNDESLETGINSSRNLDLPAGNTDEILAECEAAGIPFVKAERPRVLGFPLHQVKMALAYFRYRYPDEESRQELRSFQGTLIYFLRKKCWNLNQNFLGNLCAYELVPDWVFNLCLSDQTLTGVV
jgi:hypothetical protein